MKSKGFQFECILSGALSPVKAKFLEPMLCCAARELPEGSEWQYEIKLDGYRAIGVKSGGRIQLWSRNRRDFSSRFRRVVDALAALPDETVIDGEIVALDSDGLPAFNRLQNFDGDQSTVVFYGFDLPIFGGLDLRRQPLETRREMLRETIALLPDAVRYSETFEVPASRLMKLVREKGLEGVVAKRRDSTYQAKRRSDDWIKVRANRAADFVIGGYVPTARSFDTILVGRYEGGAFMYAGSVRAGFAPGARRSLLSDFLRLRGDRCPFANLPEWTRGRWGDGITAERMRDCRWLEPKLLAAIEYLEWTPQKRLRHPRFVGMRLDKAMRKGRDRVSG